VVGDGEGGDGDGDVEGHVVHSTAGRRGGEGLETGVRSTLSVELCTRGVNTGVFRNNNVLLISKIIFRLCLRFPSFSTGLPREGLKTQKG